jgi:hypothetical protein
MVAMGEGDASEGRGAEGSGHAWHDLERNPSVAEGLGFFAAAAEHERIATLEAHHTFTASGRFDHGLMKDRPALGMAAGQLVDTNAPRVGRRVVKQPYRYESIVKHQIGLAEAFDGT